MVVVDVTESGGLNPHIKEGSYCGRLAGIVERVLQLKDDKGSVTEEVPRWEWVFGLRTKGEGDIKFTMLTSPKMSRRSKAYACAKALRGGEPLEIGKQFDTDELVGLYATLVVKDKEPKADKLGNINITSEIKDMLPADKPEEEIVIEGLIDEEETGEAVGQQVQPPVPPAQKPPASSSGAVKKKK